MANNVTLDGPGSGGDTISTEDIGGVEYQRIKLIDGTTSSTTVIASGGGVEAAALRVTIANDSTGVLSIDDNSSSLTVDSGATFTIQEDGAALTALQIIDDWDESDRAKVNLIVGQAGVAAGAGAVGVTVPRVTLASDDPAVALLVTIDSDTNTIQTNTTTIAGAISAGQMQVDIVADGAGLATSANQLADGHNVTVDNASLTVDLGVNNDVTIDGSSVVSVDDTTTHVTGTTEGINIMAVATPTDAAVAANDIGMVAMSVDRRLHVDADITASVTLTVDGSGVTQPVSAASLPLPAGAATAAAQLADGHNVTVDNVGGVEVVQVTAGDLNCTEASASGILTDTGVIASDTTSIDGKITACDTGAVVVTTLPRSQIGPAEPGTAIDSYIHVAINLTTAADQVLVSSAANKQIWIYGYAFTCGTADGQTVSLQDELDVALTGVMVFAKYGGISVPPSGNFSMPIFKLGTDKDLEIDITGGDVDGYIAYSIVSV